MSQTDHPSCDSIPESESMLENDCEDIDGISNVKCSFEPYQGEPLAMASDEESSEDEADMQRRHSTVCFEAAFE